MENFLKAMQEVINLLKQGLAEIKEILDNDDGITCGGCEYYDVDDDRCSAFECNGIDCPKLPCEVDDDD